MIWNVPGLKGGRRSKALTQGIDYLPTLIELTGGKALPELPGRTIFTSASYGELSRDLVEKNKMSQEDPEAPLHTLAEENSSDSTNRYSMVRTHEWKFPLS